MICSCRLSSSLSRSTIKTPRSRQLVNKYSNLDLQESKDRFVLNLLRTIYEDAGYVRQFHNDGTSTSYTQQMIFDETHPSEPTELGISVHLKLKRFIQNLKSAVLNEERKRKHDEDMLILDSEQTETVLPIRKYKTKNCLLSHHRIFLRMLHISQLSLMIFDVIFPRMLHISQLSLMIFDVIFPRMLQISQLSLMIFDVIFPRMLHLSQLWLMLFDVIFPRMLHLGQL